jgi:phosphoadenosine phosphosulfate reductase
MEVNLEEVLLTLTGLNIPCLNEQLKNAPATEILQWAWDTFGPNVAASSSFQTQSVPLLHMISQVCPAMPVIFLDTGFHYPETLKFRSQLQTQLNLNIIIAHPAIEKSQLMAQYGQALYRKDPDLCCYINKIEPMQRTLTGFAGWISGVRRDQTANRQNLPILETQSSGPLKIYPLLNWTRQQIYTYINQYKLPSHSLLAQGYTSVGCVPCTRPVQPGEDERAGRWAGTDKNECGLHLDLTQLQEENTT